MSAVRDTLYKYEKEIKIGPGVVQGDQKEHLDEKNKKPCDTLPLICLMFPVFRFYIPAALLSFNSYTS
jgi:hypothetical protein